MLEIKGESNRKIKEMNITEADYVACDVTI